RTTNMNVTPLTVRCPKCGSGRIAYSCEPDCCFNHVCEDCLTSFLLATRDAGQTITGTVAHQIEKDPCAPTARCARCQSLEVHSFVAGNSTGSAAICGKCGSVLEVLFE